MRDFLFMVGGLLPTLLLSSLFVLIISAITGASFSDR